MLDRSVRLNGEGGVEFSGRPYDFVKEAYLTVDSPSLLEASRFEGLAESLV